VPCQAFFWDFFGGSVFLRFFQGRKPKRCFAACRAIGRAKTHPPVILSEAKNPGSSNPQMLRDAQHDSEALGGQPYEALK
jgi:hypothetical protein